MVDDNKIQRYWPLEVTGQDRGYRMELRAALAWELIHHFGSVAGEDGGEDSQGRSKLRLQTPGELVSRVYSIVDIFIAAAEQREEIRAIDMTEEEAYERAGELARLRSRAEYPIVDMPKTTDENPEAQAILSLRSRHMIERSDMRRRQAKELEDAAKATKQ